MKISRTSIADVLVIEPRVYSDDRGWFMESFNDERFRTELTSLGLSCPGTFVQDNHSSSKKGVLRGLHFQMAPHAQGKLVRVVKGAAFDVAVDIRKDSPTYKKWVAVELSSDNKKMLWIPKGFAHGFLALEEGTEFLYKTTDYYDPSSEQSIRWDDQAFAIDWPVDNDLIVSLKDSNAPTFSEIEGGLK
ncbi:dTDP-4-dehydrorhamnose 3,5-epimerase [Pseudomonas bubulae]|uniref:dTDP-4-dehydrorhamnose 3,5-epimerase n=1 Tax=Pseudomonas bubulae TaxID=2316085 RepID=UPI001F24EFB9|nr:dTDP-4-dehydrorhamnose 3,5-epimerase [Pseudomonas bubulae]MCF3191595.1 dTDP-4-dehydrorhamnose 3,5-epimerase [Pseudomonas bubulae]